MIELILSLVMNPPLMAYRVGGHALGFTKWIKLGKNGAGGRGSWGEDVYVWPLETGPRCLLPRPQDSG